jgi:hypothetical protein
MTAGLAYYFAKLDILNIGTKKKKGRSTGLQPGDKKKSCGKGLQPRQSPAK